MAYRISEKCKACGKCEFICPVEAITRVEKQYKIDPEACVECSVCVEECPEDAIVVS